MCTVYPRWRGEHIFASGLASISSGLSPLARGTREENRDCRTPARFIPAGAGNTRWSALQACLFAVYPRWRGEHWVTKKGPRKLCGLSPLARGTRIIRPARTKKLRFIPAGAGNTAVSDGLSQAMPVYPRWRGEHYQKAARRYLWYGLSPLARGTRQVQCHQFQL